MKWIKTMFFVCLLPFFSLGQSFEGTIIYEMEIKNPIPEKMTDEEFAKKMGGQTTFNQTYYYKDNKYKSVLGAGKMFLYTPETLRLYMYNEGDKEGSWIDVTKGGGDLEIIKLNETATILGITCQALQIKSSSTVTTYYYSATYKVDYEKFKGHKYGDWEAYLKETCGLPLKTILQTPYSHIVSTATSIKEEKLDDAIFVLPQMKTKEIVLPF